MNKFKVITKGYFTELKTALDKVKISDIEKVAEILLEAYKNDKTIFIFGNGGAAATASHIACDLGKGTLTNVYDHTEKRLKVVSLTDNIPIMTAYANDLSYDDMFVQQLHSLLNSGDIVIGISGSGNTPNVIKAFMYAKQCGATTVGFLGYHSGGKARAFVDYDITIKSSNYGVIEDIHMSLGHALTSCLSYLKKHLHEQKSLKNGNILTKSRLKSSMKDYIPGEWTERSARR
ncbi:MAG: hypothetical protein A3C30_03135 [Candidatus Levybacteria bacterium RIFCSPHIGHO2_02_FULL_40_18]|nr:MAG: hypothetical protein A2869_04885 [Candidatus Levybacteria bacterium RIFCSPHIGHO2_01_FULL_40_58]OGH26547.1 MAG: hypothetical protein A3C30_03135 [Candidatus Levybacteria bacterium RIFCSPHIGHO2_02_FULL_40_18]OGH31536.1 MAG: hypothetical protein A3E43_02225 [Candidatus Levybacteria bacterium RIFCSPHIGHO2_12_FULL_40_31]OGH40300.1 MAG: hypothetical protein A2894_00775 [Candidatus Levybacteria bacterium RIFCSPLOWO2_01_FULL_40_64]OGH49504.1 MAG: hypothetical protein A3I54_03185 [Candidatus Lev